MPYSREDINHSAVKSVISADTVAVILCCAVEVHVVEYRIEVMSALNRL